MYPAHAKLARRSEEGAGAAGSGGAPLLRTLRLRTLVRTLRLRTLVRTLLLRTVLLRCCCGRELCCVLLCVLLLLLPLRCCCGGGREASARRECARAPGAAVRGSGSAALELGRGDQRSAYRQGGAQAGGEGG